MNILITGGFGFIGSNLIPRLLKQGCNVFVIDNLSEQIHDQHTHHIYKNYGCKYEIADIRNFTVVKKMFDNKIDILVHLAAETGTGQSMYEIERYVSVNEYGTSVILEAMIQSKKIPAKVILTSSRSVYGEGAYIDNYGVLKENVSRKKTDLDNYKWGIYDNGNELFPVATPETFPFHPKSIYAATKVAQENLLKIFCETVGAQLTILRLQNVYGIGQSLKNPYTGIISIFYNKARQGLDIPVFEDGNPVRDFIYVDDVVDAIYLAIQNSGDSSETYNIGSGVGLTINELAKKIIDISGVESKIINTKQYRMGDIRHCIANVGKAKEIINFNPKISINEGIKLFIDWAKNQKEYTDLTDSANTELKKYGLSK
jgi:dTDP-L-rhamnose 4-epimerase